MTPLRENSTLPAAGAYDPAPASVALPPNIARLTVHCVYTLSTAMGASGGYARLHPEWLVAGAWVPDPAVLSSSTVAGYLRTVLGGNEAQLPSPAVSTIAVSLPFVVIDGASAFRCSAAEAGDTGHPGDLAISVASGRGR